MRLITHKGARGGRNGLQWFCNIHDRNLGICISLRDLLRYKTTKLSFYSIIFSALAMVFWRIYFGETQLIVGNYGDVVDGALLRV
jgi:hypothetical protein